MIPPSHSIVGPEIPPPLSPHCPIISTKQPDESLPFSPTAVQYLEMKNADTLETHRPSSIVEKRKGQAESDRSMLIMGRRY
jgi:hypothetical protein